MRRRARGRKEEKEEKVEKDEEDVLGPGPHARDEGGAALENSKRTSQTTNKHSNTPTPCRHGGGFN